MNKMCIRVLALALMVGVAHCLTWEIVVAKPKRLEFYKNGNLTHTEEIPSANHITSVTYDPVHYRVLFVDCHNPNVSISSFDLLTTKIQPLITIKSDPPGFSARVAYDPVTDLVFWKQDTKIYSLSLHPAYSNKEDNVNILVSMQYYCADIAVDSCGGYMYWIVGYKIGRIRLDGSEREVLIESTGNIRTLAIDQQTQKMYWFETSGKQVSIESADLDGKNRITLYITKNQTSPCSLAVSKDLIYWRSSEKDMWQIPKNPHEHVEAKLFTNFDTPYNDIYQIVAAKYTIEELIQGHQNCESLKSLIRETPDECLFCNHGTKVSGESRCECAQGYTGERCDVSICHNYCLEGDCSVSAEGKPKCRCNAGYSGERCEVNACHKHCLHNAPCSLNEEDEPVCECSTDYEGERCEVTTIQTSVHTDKTMKELLRNLRVFSYKHDEYEIKV